MNEKQLTQYLLNKPESVQDYPFGPDAAVYKVHGKMFALVGTEKLEDGRFQLRINLKCDPMEAMQLRDVFDCVIPGYHMNKTHWNTVILDGSLPDGEIERMIDNSYALVVKGLPKKERQGLQVRHGSEAIS